MSTGLRDMSISQYWSLESLCAEHSFDKMIKAKSIVNEIDPQHNTIHEHDALLERPDRLAHDLPRESHCGFSQLASNVHSCQYQDTLD
jgi:hypothetical protein